MLDHALQRCLEAAPEHEAAIRRLFDISPLFGQLMRSADDDECREVLRSVAAVQLPDDSPSWRAAVAGDDEQACLRQLRQLKCRGLRRILWWELGLHGDVLLSAKSLALLAEQLLAAALTMAGLLLAPRFGGLPGARFAMIGLGKLGGSELNLASDVDLLFIWQVPEGQTTGPRRIDAKDYMQHLARQIIRLFSERTGDGLVWPVDMRLRPGGDAGPIGLSLDATLQHYQNYGQTWERAMLIKARAVAGDAALGQSFIDGVRPFVFRRYLDYTTVRALADMKRRIDAQAGSRGIGPGFDVKRGHGGIREIEFYIQSLQLLHGGHRACLRPSATMAAIEALVAEGLLDADDGDKLATAYRFWRRIEHALQGRRGEQTHALPEDYMTYLALATGLKDVGEHLRQQAAVVNGYFQSQFVDVELGDADEDWLHKPQQEIGRHFTLHGAEDHARVFHALAEIRGQLARGLLPERSQADIERILAVAMPAWAADANGVQAVESFAELLKRIAGRATWIDLLVSNKGVRQWLIGVLSASRYIAEHVVCDPSWLEWPLEHGRGEERIHHLLGQLRRLPEAGLELDAFLADLGHGVDQARLTSAMAIAADEADPLTIGSWLADTADAALAAILALSLRQFGLPADFPLVCLAMGKQGSREMGLVSDLDLVFVLVHDDPGGAGPGGRNWREWAQRVGRRIIQHLTARPPFGAGYQLDARLRPSGQSGVLVTTLAAFRDYQLQQAQTWEHQALCRARAAAGPAAAQDKVTAVVEEVLALPRDAGPLARDVLAMRAKMLEHLGSKDDSVINLKHDAGGLVDIEFLAQYARLRFGTAERGTVACLRASGELPALWRQHAGRLANTYLAYRQMENALRAQLWSSIGRLPARDEAPEWETLRRHAPIKTVADLRGHMRWVRATFEALLRREQES